jgi:uncharacterized protein DUF4252
MRTLKLATLLAPAMLAALQASAAQATDGRLALPDFKALEAKASESVSVTLDSSLIGLAARFLDPAKPEDAAARQVIAGITGIYVRSFTFDGEFVYPREDVERLRMQLSPPRWQPLVQVHSRKVGNDVDVYVAMEGSRTTGLTIIASEPHEFTVVNIVGSVDLQKLHQLEGHFGIPKLQLDEQQKK